MAVTSAHGHGRRQAIALLSCAMLGGACTGAPTADATQHPPHLEVRDDLGAVFEDFGTPGTFALYDVAADHVIVVEDATKRVALGRELLDRLGVMAAASAGR